MKTPQNKHVCLCLYLFSVNQKLYVMKNTRRCIYTKDVQTITGRSASASRRLLQRIRKRYWKRPHQFVSLQEFCDYTGLPEEEVIKNISG